MDLTSAVNAAVADRAAQIKAVRDGIQSYVNRYVASLNHEASGAAPSRVAQINAILAQIQNTPMPAAPDPNDYGSMLSSLFGANSKSIVNYGASTSGDASAGINKAMADCAASGTPLVMPAGHYTCGKALIVPDRLIWWGLSGSRIDFPFTTHGNDGAITNANLGTALDNVQFFGGSYGKTGPNIPGRVFALNMTGTIEGVIADTFYGDSTNGGGAFFFATRFTRHAAGLSVGYCQAINCHGGGGCAGLRLLAAPGKTTSFSGYYNIINSYDQALQFAVSAGSGPVANQDIRNPSHELSIGNSLASESIATTTNATQSGNVLSCSIKNFSFDWIAGDSLSRAIYVENGASVTGLINNGELSNIFLDCGQDTGHQYKVLFRNKPGMGGCKNITTSLVALLNANNHKIQNDGTRNVDTSGVDFTNVAA